MILSMTAYNTGYSDAISGDAYNCPYTTKDERSADYAFGFEIGLKEYKES